MKKILLSYSFLISFFFIFNILNVKGLETTDIGLVLNGSKYVVVEKGSTWIDPGAKVQNFDPSGSITTNFNTDYLLVAGEYKITYTASDSLGTKYETQRLLKVVDNYTGQNIDFSEVKTYGGNGRDQFFDIEKTNDGGYIVVGHVTRQSSNYINAIKFNSQHEKEWERLISTNYNPNIFEVYGSIEPYSYSIELLNNGNFVITGVSENSYNYTNYNYDYKSTIIVLNSSGDDVLKTTTPYGYVFKGLAKSSDGGFYIAGYTKSTCDVTTTECTTGTTSNYDAILLKYNSDLTKSWEKKFSGSNNDYLYGVLELNDGSIAISGASYSYDNDFLLYQSKAHDDAFVARLTPVTANNITTVTTNWFKSLGSAASNENLAKIYQDSHNDIIFYGNYSYSGYVIKYNLAGTELFKKPNFYMSNEVEYFDMRVIFNLQELPNGNYLVSSGSYNSNYNSIIFELSNDGQISNLKKIDGKKSEHLYDFEIIGNQEVYVGTSDSSYGMFFNTIDTTNYNAIIYYNNIMTTDEMSVNTNVQFKSDVDLASQITLKDKSQQTLAFTLKVYDGENNLLSSNTVNENDIVTKSYNFHVTHGDYTYVLKRDFTFSDFTIPILTVEGPTYYTISQGTKYILPKVTAYDYLNNVETDLTDQVQVTVNGSKTQTIKYDVSGENIVTFTVSDEYGNIASKSIIIRIVATNDNSLTDSYSDTTYSYSNGYENQFKHIIKTSDGGYLAVGNTNYQWNYDAVIIKYNSNNEKVWEKRFGGHSTEYFNKVIETNDGYVAVGVGYTYTDISGSINSELGNGEYDILIVKYDKEGNVLWYNLYGGGSYDEPQDIIESNSGNYIVVGYSHPNTNTGEISDSFHGSNSPDALFVEFSASNGEVLSDDLFGGSSEDYFYEVIKTSTGYKAIGKANSKDGDLVLDNNNYYWNYLVVANYDLNGNLINTVKNLQVQGIDMIKNVITNSDGSYIIIIKSYDYYQESRMIKYSAQDVMVWNKKIEGSKFNVQAAFTKGNDEFVVVGIQDSLNTRVILTYNTNGTLLEKSYQFVGKESSIYSGTVINGDYYFAGYIKNNNISDGLITKYTKDKYSIYTTNDEILIPYNTSFDLLEGVTAFDDLGNDITSQVKVIGTVDNKTFGTQQVFYQINFGDYSLVSSRNYKVLDDIFPEINLEGTEFYIVNKGYNWVDPGYTATDDIDTNVIVKVINDVDTSKVGNYIVKYIATDDYGNSTIKTRIVRVVDGLSSESNINFESISSTEGMPYQNYNSFISVDDGYIMVTASIQDSYNNKLIITKLGLDERKVWEKTYQINGQFYIKDIRKTSDSGILITGETDDSSGELFKNNKGNLDGFIFKLNQNGELLWSNNFGGSDNDYFDNVLELTNGNYVVVGRTFSNDFDINGKNKGEQDAMIVAYNAQGTHLWSNFYGGRSNDYFTIALPTADGVIAYGYGLLTAGETLDATKYGSIAIKYDNNGAFVSKNESKIFFQDYYDSGSKYYLLENGNILKVSYWEMTEFKTSGEYLWNYYTDNKKMFLITDEGYFISTNNSIIKLNKSGQEIFRYQLERSASFNYTLELENGKYVGYVNLNDSNYYIVIKPYEYALDGYEDITLDLHSTFNYQNIIKIRDRNNNLIPITPTGDVNIDTSVLGIQTISYNFVLEDLTIAFTQNVLVKPRISGIDNLTYDSAVTPVFDGVGVLNGTPFISGTQISLPGNYELTITAKDFSQTFTFVINPKVEGVANLLTYDGPVTPIFTGVGVLNGQSFSSNTEILDAGKHLLEVTENGVTKKIEFTIKLNLNNHKFVEDKEIVTFEPLQLTFNSNLVKLNGVDVQSGVTISEPGQYKLTILNPKDQTVYKEMIISYYTENDFEKGQIVLEQVNSNNNYRLIYKLNKLYLSYLVKDLEGTTFDISVSGRNYTMNCVNNYCESDIEVILVHEVNPILNYQIYVEVMVLTATEPLSNSFEVNIPTGIDLCYDPEEYGVNVTKDYCDYVSIAEIRDMKNTLKDIIKRITTLEEGINLLTNRVSQLELDVTRLSDGYEVMLNQLNVISADLNDVKVSVEEIKSGSKEAQMSFINLFVLNAKASGGTVNIGEKMKFEFNKNYRLTIEGTNGDGESQKETYLVKSTSDGISFEIENFGEKGFFNLTTISIGAAGIVAVVGLGVFFVLKRRR